MRHFFPTSVKSSVSPRSVVPLQNNVHHHEAQDHQHPERDREAVEVAVDELADRCPVPVDEPRHDEEAKGGRRFNFVIGGYPAVKNDNDNPKVKEDE